MEDRALLIEWDGPTGRRAGNIDVKHEPNLICHNWQNMNKMPHVELRLVMDDRDMSKYRDMDGVTVLIGKDQINQAIDDNFEDRIKVEDDLIYSEHVKEKVRNKKISIDDLPDDRTERLRMLKDVYKVKGIRVLKPGKI